jgi:hypothetical protein
MKVTDPGGQVLVTSTDEGNTFNNNGEKQYYSSKKEVNYENESVEMCLSFTKKDSDDFKSGKYKVEVFCDATQIGNTTFELK